MNPNREEDLFALALALEKPAEKRAVFLNVMDAGLFRGGALSPLCPRTFLMASVDTLAVGEFPSCRY